MKITLPGIASQSGIAWGLSASAFLWQEQVAVEFTTTHGIFMGQGL